ncbi:MAG: HNH endonuclease signature motif containing protein [Vitreimonas sp.]
MAMSRPNEFSRPTQVAALLRQQHRCACCGTPITALGAAGRDQHKFGEGARAHHMRHVKEGGSDVVENCVILCESCHYSAHEGGNYRFGKEQSAAEDYPHFLG